mgnify:FL=1
MKNRFLVFYTILISVIYLLGVGYFGYSLFVEYSNASSNIYYIFNTTKILESLKISIIIIASATVLTIILLIVTYCKKQKKYNMVMEDGEAAINDDNIVEEDELDNEIEEENADDSEELKETSQEEVQNEEKNELPSEECKPVMIEDSNVLFSEKTHFIMEEYLENRLNSELNRAISSEFDLALFIIQIKNLNKDADYIEKLSDYISVQFQFKDLIFEFKDDCIACIKTNCIIDDAVALADKIHKEIVDITKEKCYIGVSTRSIRMISAERIITEAYEALKHAHEDEENPIIGFRVNAEKYMEMMKNQ